MRKVLADMHVPPAWRRWIARISLALGVALLVAFVPWRLGSGGDRAAKLDAQLDRVRDEVRALEEENARLGHEIRALRTDPQAIEDHARDELGMVYPGELILQLPPTEAP